MWFLMWLFTGIANASPAGTVSFGGITLGAALPSGFFRLYNESGEVVQNLYGKRGALAGVSGIYQVETCRGIVYDVSFHSSNVTPRFDHTLWSKALQEKGFKMKPFLFVTKEMAEVNDYDYCWKSDSTTSVCFTQWTNGSREITMFANDSGYALLSEDLDKTCTEGI